MNPIESGILWASTPEQLKKNFEAPAPLACWEHKCSPQGKQIRLIVSKNIECPFCHTKLEAPK